ncbi:EAL domain-containing protein [Subtercola boreus]|nr:EAL domain-containing protein [Subtercola boreus]
MDLVTSYPLAARTRGGLTQAPAFSQLVEIDYVTSSPTDPGYSPVVAVLTLNHSNGPGELLRQAESLRAAGNRIALANVGESPASVAVLPLLQPDLIQINLPALQRQPDFQSSQTYNALSGYAEELPAVVLASGVTTEDDRLLAAAFGATLGEGTYFSSLADAQEPAGIRFAAEPRTTAPQTTPFLIAARRGQVATASRTQLLKTSHILETCAFDCDEATVVMSTFQKSTNLTPNTIELYSALARNLSYVFAFTHPVDISETSLQEIPDLRIHTFARHDPLSLEWDLIIVNARYQVLLAARENPESTDEATEFDFVVTHDRPTILSAAQSLTSYL